MQIRTQLYDIVPSSNPATDLQKQQHMSVIINFHVEKHSYEINQQYATIYIYINLFLFISSTYFGRCFRPLSGALDCIYSIW
jgi:hypothetical protein